MSSTTHFPAEWRSKTIGETMDLINGMAFKPSDWKSTGLPIIRIQNLNDRTAPFNCCDTAVDSRYYVHNDDLLFAWSGNRGTSFGPFIWDRGKAILNQHIFRIAFRDGELNKRFCYYFLKWLVTAIENNAHGSVGIVHVTKSTLEAFSIAIPPLLEQRRIADILGAVDENIEKTQALIAKLQDLKKATMQELLTRGIGHTKFKDSLVGRIPENWKVVGLEAFLQRPNGLKPGPFGSSITKSMYQTHGYKVYGQEQVIAGDLRVGDYYISKKKYQELVHFSVSEGDILVSLVGTVGRVLVVKPPFEPGIINPRLARLRPSSSETNAGYLKHLLQSPLVELQSRMYAQGGTMDVLSGTILRLLRFPKPGLSEQESIANCLDSIDTRMMAIKQRLNKLRHLKKALMQDLLTGEVRVKA